jgi:CubicO group peptidase (beta-lactamase class C family)
MNNTHWHITDFEDPSIVTTLYMIIDGELTPLPPYSITTWPDGGLRTTSDDLANYLTAVMNGGLFEEARILSEKNVEEMLHPQTPSDMALQIGDEVMDFQGIFWQGLRGMIGHTGEDPGVLTAMVYSPEAEVGVVLLLNAVIEDIELFAGLVFAAFELGMTL